VIAQGSAFFEEEGCIEVILGVWREKSPYYLPL